MKIRTCHCPAPFTWSAIDDDTYDGAEDSGTRHEIGCGNTEAEAIADLKRLLAEKAEYREDLAEGKHGGKS